jgi:hypothetical protein
MTITVADYFMGRDKIYANDLTDTIKTNAVETVNRANLLLDDFYAANPAAHQRTVNSGWRPPEINAGVKGAALRSHHMTGEAVDLNDDDGQLDAWCISPAGQSALNLRGLWLESPGSTPRWCHCQIVPPRSGRRVFQP